MQKIKATGMKNSAYQLVRFSKMQSLFGGVASPKFPVAFGDCSLEQRTFYFSGRKRNGFALFFYFRKEVFDYASFRP